MPPRNGLLRQLLQPLSLRNTSSVLSATPVSRSVPTILPTASSSETRAPANTRRLGSAMLPSRARISGLACSGMCVAVNAASRKNGAAACRRMKATDSSAKVSVRYPDAGTTVVPRRMGLPGSSPK